MNFVDQIFNQDCIQGMRSLPDGCVNTCVTSPPYWGLRDYGHEGQIGLEETPEAFVSQMVEVFREVKRLLRNDGTLWLNLGDNYNGSGGAGSVDYAREKHKEFGKDFNMGRYQPPTRISYLKPKDLVGIPWRVAFALQADGWYLRQDIIWHKPNPMPESVTDRCTKAHEYIFLLSKSPRYYFDSEAIKEEAKYGINGQDSRPAGVVRNREYNYDSKENNNPEAYMKADKRAGKGRIAYEGKRTIDKSGKNGQESSVTINETRNKRSVWTVTTKPFKDAHFATYPEDLIVPCILAGCPEGGLVLDPFMGAGTTALVSKKLGRNYVGFELNEEYKNIAEKRLTKTLGMFAL